MANVAVIGAGSWGTALAACFIIMEIKLQSVYNGVRN